MPDTSDTSDTSDREEPTGLFDAFRARRAQEQAANEPFPAEYTAQDYTAQEHAGQEDTAQEYTYFPGENGQPLAVTTAVARRGRLRSVAVLTGAAVLVAGVVGGVYAATRTSGGPAAAPGVVSSASPSASATKDAKGTKGGKAAAARLTVTSVSSDSFTARAADGRTVTAQITTTTKFGTAARPFTRSQLVTGAVVYARLRRAADGTVVATVIASSVADKGAAASGSPDAGT